VICSDFSGVMISGKTKGNAHCKKIKEQLTEAFSFQMDSNNETPIGCNSYGFILRTNSKDAPFETVLAEANSLLSQYQRILKQATYGCAYETLYRNEPEYLEHIKGIPLIQEIEIVTDDISIYNAIQDGLPELIPTQLRLYNDSLLPLYKLYSLETELEKALNRKIWLKSGGTLIIEQTEALTVVDVNTGKYVTKKQGEQGKRAAIMQINMEAAIEIARQIRLRNISGIIIVDFINMKYDDDINELITCLKRILKSDKIKTTFIDMTKLGLVEITRKKSGKSLKEAWYGEFNDN
jgi:ribonuclease G